MCGPCYCEIWGVRAGPATLVGGLDVTNLLEQSRSTHAPRAKPRSHFAHCDVVLNDGIVA